MTEDERELLKLRADYAWKWFDLHAKQRMTLFNYFLIIAGIFANATLLTFKDSASASGNTGSSQLVQSVSATTLPTTLPVTIQQTAGISQNAQPTTATAMAT